MSLGGWTAFLVMQDPQGPQSPDRRNANSTTKATPVKWPEKVFLLQDWSTAMTQITKSRTAPARSAFNHMLQPHQLQPGRLWRSRLAETIRTHRRIRHSRRYLR